MQKSKIIREIAGEGKRLTERKRETRRIGGGGVS